METFVGFDSAWMGNVKAPGAICAVTMEDGAPVRWHPPVLVGFDQALTFITDVTRGSRYSLVALDQPTVVPNLTSNRPVERLAGSLVAWNGGGTQSSNRGRLGMFCAASPIWGFLRSLGAIEDPEAARTATDGLYLVETYPAAALPTLAASSFGRLAALKYNPKPRSKFRPDDWITVATAAQAESLSLGCADVADWCVTAAGIPKVVKADQDKLDAVICVLVAIRWRLRPRTNSVMLGDLVTGYMVIPASPDVGAYLTAAVKDKGVPIDGQVPV
jgi:predicted RNase H-like nuclease